MRCANCNTDNPEGARFCIECGTAVSVKCDRCGAPNPAIARFCAECGAPVGTSARPARTASTASAVTAEPSASSRSSSFRIAEGSESFAHNFTDDERKTVSALFADIKGSTELMEDLDPEEARALVDPALQLMIEAARRYDGYIVQSTGDGIFALFGAPVAHEEHPQRAVHAALHMQRGIQNYAARLRAEGRPPIEIRVGINTGEVVVRSIRTGERSTEYTPIGHTANLAARLQAIAPTGAVVVSASTARLVTGYFELKPMGPVRVKGVSEPVSVYEVAGLGPLRTRLQASAMRGLTKFVGRRAELDRMRQTLELAAGGRGQIVAVVGEAGLGKSRLFHEFKASAVSGCLVLEAIAISHGKASAWLPVIGLLNDYFGIATGDTARVRRERITGKALMLERSLEDTLPYLFSLLGIQEGSDPLAQMDVGIKRQRTLMAIGRILMRESYSQPLVLIFEDLHWIDSSTQALLDLIAEHIGGDRALMLTNYRPEYRHGWAAYPYYTELRLDPLAGANASDMLAGLIGESAVVDDELAALARLIAERTAGNPLFIEEIVRALFEQNILARNGRVKLLRPLEEVRIPPTVEAILAARIDRLDPPEKALLQRLAVLGRRFTLSVAGGMAAPTDELGGHSVEPMLASLQAADFIYEEPGLPDIGYSFKHTLTQEVAYNSILSNRRKALHERAAEAIETAYAENLDDHLIELAHHYERGGNASKAAEYLDRAADQAVRRIAYAEAVGHLNAALKLLETLPESEERQRRELDLQSRLGENLIPLRSPASIEVKRAFDRARELSQRLGDLDSLFWVLFGLQFFYSLRHDLATARELGERQLILAERTGDPAMRAAACGALATTMLICGEFETTLELCERGLVATAWTNTPKSSIGNPRPLMLSLSASSLLILGYPARAIERSRAALAAGEAEGSYSHAMALNYAAQLRIRLCDFEGVLEYADTLTALAKDKGFPMWEAQATYLRGSALIELGRADQGLALLRESGAAYESTGAVAGIWRLDAAEALGKLGRADEAIELLAELGESAAHNGVGLIAAGIPRVRAGLLLLKGGADANEAAEKSLREAIGIARRQRARLFELRAAIELARLLTAQGRRLEARAELAPIYSTFTDGFDFPYLTDARKLLTEIEEKTSEASFNG